MLIPEPDARVRKVCNEAVYVTRASIAQSGRDELLTPAKLPMICEPVHGQQGRRGFKWTPSNRQETAMDKQERNFITTETANIMTLIVFLTGSLLVLL